MSTTKSGLIGYIGKKIRKLREDKGYTQEEFAFLVDISRGHYSCIETGKFGASIEKLTDIAIALNVQVGDFFPPLPELKNIRIRDKN